MDILKQLGESVDMLNIVGRLRYESRKLLWWRSCGEDFVVDEVRVGRLWSVVDEVRVGRLWSVELCGR